MNDPSRLSRLARAVARYRRAVIGAWIALSLLGVFAAVRVSDRWFGGSSTPGPAYAANQRAVEIFRSGEQYPMVAVFHSGGDITKAGGVQSAIEAAARVNPGSRTSSYWSTGSAAYLSRDRHTAFAMIYPPGQPSVTRDGLHVRQVRAALKAQTPPRVSAHLTGQDPLSQASGASGTAPSLLVETLLAAFGALVILVFVFGTLPAVAMPLAVALASILNTFTLVWLLTYVMRVSIGVEFLIALVGLGVAIDYALLMIFRFRDELRSGADVEAALVQTMRHAGGSVIVSGSTAAVGLLALVILPMPFIRSFGIGGLLIPAVSVLAAITLLPALLAVVGRRINSVRLLPRRFADRGQAEDGAWGRWARLVLRWPFAAAGVGLAVVGVLVAIGLQVNPAEPQAKDLPGTGDAIAGRAVLADAGITPGIYRPFVVLVEPGRDPQAAVARVQKVRGVAAAVAPRQWRKHGYALIEAFPSVDGGSRAVRATIDRTRAALAGTDATLGGVSPEDRDLVHGIYGTFPFVLGFVVLLTLFLLARAFRSVVLAVKAVLLNLLSLGAAVGIVVFVFQQGHGAEAIWHVQATDSIVPWIPLMIFAFLYGLSMDYEVFMLTRMREAYDDTGSTDRAIELGLARTGKLVTSAALVLMLAFFVLSTGPGVDLKQFAIALAAGIVFDATVIRALLVPSLMKLLGEWNWWFPEPVARVLRVAPERRGLRHAPGLTRPVS
jgi:putative drug exporter of the RND superfamily